MPALVGLFGLEADVGGLGAFVGVGFDQSGGAAVAANRGDGHGQVVVVLQMPGDGVGAGVEALAGQGVAQLDDQVDGGLR